MCALTACTAVVAPRRRARSQLAHAIAAVPEARPPPADVLHSPARASPRDRPCRSAPSMQPHHAPQLNSAAPASSAAPTRQHRLMPVAQLVAEAEAEVASNRFSPHPRDSVRAEPFPPVRSRSPPPFVSSPSIHHRSFWGSRPNPNSVPSSVPASRSASQRNAALSLSPEIVFGQNVHSNLRDPGPSSSSEQWPPHMVSLDAAPFAQASGAQAELKRYAKLLTPFIYKLFCLVTDDKTNGLCEWARGGTSFIVHDPVVFSAKVLPFYFKHNQFSSFVRQLNKYSFHKLAPGAFMFGHTYFLKDRPNLLLRIGPPRPQERGGERPRNSPAGGGGASLNSLQHSNYEVNASEAGSHSRQHMMEREMSVDVFNRQHSLYNDAAPSAIESRPLVNVRRNRAPLMQFKFAAHSAYGARPGDARPGDARPGELREQYMLRRGEDSAERKPSDVQNSDIALKADVDFMMSRLQQTLSESLRRDLSVASRERGELLGRLCESERRCEALEHHTNELKRRVETLERAALGSPARKRHHAERRGFTTTNRSAEDVGNRETF